MMLRKNVYIDYYYYYYFVANFYQFKWGGGGGGVSTFVFPKKNSNSKLIFFQGN
jgi:hypothetical protein